MLRASLVLVVIFFYIGPFSHCVEIDDKVDRISNDDNELKLPWKHIVERVKIEKDELQKDRMKKREEAKAQLEMKRKEALKFMNTFFSEFFSDDFLDADSELRPPTQELERVEQVASEEKPMMTLKHSVTVNNKTQNGTTVIHAESLLPLIKQGMGYLFSTDLEKSSTIESFYYILPFLAPFILILAPFLLIGILPSMFFTVLFIMFGVLAFVFFLPMIPLGGLFSTIFMSDIFTPDSFSTKEDHFLDYDPIDYVQPFLEAITEANISNDTASTVANIVSNVPRMFSYN